MRQRRRNPQLYARESCCWLRDRKITHRSDWIIIRIFPVAIIFRLICIIIITIVKHQRSTISHHRTLSMCIRIQQLWARLRDGTCQRRRLVIIGGISAVWGRVKQRHVGVDWRQECTIWYEARRSDRRLSTRCLQMALLQHNLALQRNANVGLWATVNLLNTITTIRRR